MKNIINLFIVFLLLGLFFENLKGQASLEVYQYELEQSIREIDNSISKIKDEIKKNEARIEKANSTIADANKKNDPKLLDIGQKTLDKATNAVKINTDLLSYLETQKGMKIYALSSVKKEILNPSSVKVASVVSSYYGEVLIQKAQLDKINKFDAESNIFLETGDVIMTSENSKMEMLFHNGRGNLLMGESTKICITEDSLGNQAMDLINGKVSVSYQNSAAIEEELRSLELKLKNSKTDEEKNYYEKLVKDFELLMNKQKGKWRKKFEIRRGSGTCSIRGTKFIALSDDQTGFEVIVTEGSVELTSSKDSKVIVVNEGFKGNVNPDGDISEPEKIDLSKIEKF